MNRALIAMSLCLALIGCDGEKIRDAENDVVAVGRLAASKPGRTNRREAEQFHADRAARGDTIPMPADRLRAYLPDSIPGYVAGAPSDGPTEADDRNALVLVSRTWTARDTNGSHPASLTVSITDFGGTLRSYEQIEPIISESLATDNAHLRISVVKLDVPYTAALERLDRDRGSLEIIACTRYRYVIAVESNRPETVDPLLADIATRIAESFKEK